jgi:hypothetical protein
MSGAIIRIGFHSKRHSLETKKAKRAKEAKPQAFLPFLPFLPFLFPLCIQVKEVNFSNTSQS